MVDFIVMVLLFGAVGMVQFKDGAIDLGSLVVVLFGMATFLIMVLVVGLYLLTIVFILMDSMAFVVLTLVATMYLIGTVFDVLMGVSVVVGNALVIVLWIVFVNDGGLFVRGYDV